MGLHARWADSSYRSRANGPNAFAARTAEVGSIDSGTAAAATAGKTGGRQRSAEQCARRGRRRSGIDIDPFSRIAGRSRSRSRSRSRRGGVRRTGRIGRAGFAGRCSSGCPRRWPPRVGRRSRHLFLTSQLNAMPSHTSAQPTKTPKRPGVQSVSLMGAERMAAFVTCSELWRVGWSRAARAKEDGPVRRTYPIAADAEGGPCAATQ
jgi:hypothetical protein